MKIRVNPHTVEIVKEQTEPINEREIKVSKCEFEFDEAITSDFVKEAYFTLNGDTYKQIIVNNECDYPSEVLGQKGTLEIGVVAYLVENEQEIKRYNPSPDYFESWVGSLKDAENSEPITPTDKEQMEQALQKGLNDINDKIDEVDEKLDGIDTAIEETNNLNLDVSDKVNGDVTVTLTKKDATTKSVVISDGTSLQFMWQGTSLGIKTDDMEEYVFVDLQGIQGIKGDTGEPFTIKKTYSSVAEMNADFNNMEYGDYVMIASSVEIEDNAKLYTRGESQWIFITDFSGATGIRGPVGATPNIQIGTVTSGSTPSVTRTGTDENPILNFVLQPGPQGEVGPTGLTGNGISSIEKTSTSDLVDTYTITFTNDNTTTFDVTNGKGIDRIEKTATVGNIDTYTIYFNDNSTSTFEVANGEVTREELEEEVDRLSMIYNLFPTTSDEDTEMTLDGTGEVKLKKIGLKGNTSQNTTTGKNLLPNNATSQTINGITFTKNDNGTITANGTATAKSTLYMNNANSLTEGGTYTISSGLNGESGTRLGIYINGEYYNTATDRPMTFESITDCGQSYFQIDSGKTVNNLTVYPMIEKSNSATSYEPYTNGASPNPDYPQDIHVVSGDNSIDVCGKNLFDYNKITTSAQYTNNYDGTFTRNSNGSNVLINVNDASVPYDAFSLLAGTYSVSFDIKTTATATLTNFFMCTRQNGTTANLSKSIGVQIPANTTTHIKAENYVVVNNAEKVGFAGYLNASTGVVISNIQVEKNNQATEYEAYKGASYPITLPEGMFLGWIPNTDYRDIIFQAKTGNTYYDSLDSTTKESLTYGKWYVNKQIGKVVLDGSENWGSFQIESSGLGRAIVGGNNIFYNSGEATILCNKLKGVKYGTSWTNTFDCIASFSSNRFIAYLIGATDLTTFKNKLASGFNVYYVLATPTTTEITDTTLIEQLENLENAYSYDTQTNITQTNDDMPFILDVEALMSLKYIFGNLETRVAELETSEPSEL